MISRLTGTILETTEKYAVIDVHGVGYTVYATPDTLAALASTESAMVYTHQVVREDALDLYGFTTAEDISFFELLISVSGIGPRGALTILTATSVSSLATAIATGDTGYLTKVSGIGRKTAEKIVLELRDKLQAHRRTDETHGSMRAESDVIEALKSLGYSQNEARDAVKNIPATVEGANARIKEALKILGGK